MKNLILVLSVLSMFLTACGDGKSGSTGNGRDGFPVHTDIDECNDFYLNKFVTTSSGDGVYTGVPGNDDCPYKKEIRDDLFVEAYVHRTKAGNALSIGINGISGQVSCNFQGCWSLRTQCPTGFRRAVNNQQPIFNAYAYAYLNNGPYSQQGYQNNNRRRASKYDRLPKNKAWCEPTYNHRWYDEWIDRNSHEYDDDYDYGL